MSKIEKIAEWLTAYAMKSGKDGFVVGVSGGIDSALTSTLCALTNLHVVVLRMPINQIESQNDLSKKHTSWLESRFNNVTVLEIDLSDTFNNFVSTMPVSDHGKLALANSRSRLRMVTLYQIASSRNLLVAGTGNKVEDFGVGFYTKYGDGGVDISPIADLLKSEVVELAAQLEITLEILTAPPTDGLWDDGRTDEDQLGATYDEIEWAMDYMDQTNDSQILTARQQEVLKIYQQHHNKNIHKMLPIPVCKLS